MEPETFVTKILMEDALTVQHIPLGAVIKMFAIDTLATIENTKIRRLIFIIFFINTLNCKAESINNYDWYKEYSSSCSGYTPLNTSLQTYFTGKENITNKQSNELGLLHVIDPKEYTSLSDNTPHLIESIILTPETSKSILKILTLAEEESVPMAFKASIPFLARLDIPKVFSNESSSFLFDNFISSLNYFSEKIKTLKLFIADGGEINKYLVTQSNATSRHSIITISYSVSLAKEMRQFIISSCIYPTSIKISQFKTISPMNNKILKETKPGVWRKWDVDTKRYQGGDFTYQGQDVSNYYFSEDEIEMDKKVGEKIHKISFTGGGWEFKGSDDSDYRKIYLTMEPE